MTVSVRTLKNRLSEYLRRVRRGEHLTVTAHGRPVAELHPVRSTRLSPKQRYELLVEAGEVTPPKGRGLEDLKPSKIRGPLISRTLLENRE